VVGVVLMKVDSELERAGYARFHWQLFPLLNPAPLAATCAIAIYVHPHPCVPGVNYNALMVLIAGHLDNISLCHCASGSGSHCECGAERTLVAVSRGESPLLT
jgi:hypothetical protein